MTGHLGRIATVFTLAFVLTHSADNGSAQSAHILSRLTVPAPALPVGCRLQPLDPQLAAIPQNGLIVLSGTASPVFPANPWFGTDRRLAATVRKHIDGTPRIPDGPPLDQGEIATFELKLADDVIEAYRAVYVVEDGGVIEVLAIQFNDPKWATREPPAGTLRIPRSLGARLVNAATVVLVSATESGGCFQAVGDYIRSVL